MKRGIRFSSFLMASFVSQAIGCVLLISLCLYLYFDGRITREFRDKLHAQQGQAELILEKRMEEVQRRLKDLSLDNTIRVTLMLGVAPQMEERIKAGYPAENGMYFFVRGGEGRGWVPRAYPGLDAGLVRACLPAPGDWNSGRREGADRLVWYFSAPLMRRTELLGTAVALYDPAEDRELATALRHVMEGGSDLVIRGPLRMVHLKTGAVLPGGEGHPGGPADEEEQALTPLPGNPDILFMATHTSLARERTRLALLLGTLSLVVIAFSATLGIVLGKRMARPIKELAAQAQEIGAARKVSLFEGSSIHPELNQLARAFNSMLTSLAEEKSRHAELLRHIGDAVYILDPQGGIVEAN
ncbi:MAG: HAMP domain-containing protein, partial [Desulfobacteraceae bacterium]|nr:HAMP domain-containing protein [Desulfobacteraceae bacterium]